MQDKSPDPRADPVASSLPVDSDIEVEDTRVGAPRAIHLHKRYLALVAVGGAVGTAAREAISLLVAPVGSFPVATLGINVIGAFLLGLLLEALARRGPDHGARRTLRLLLGTGALGGFTTYSTLATDTALLLQHGDARTATVYALGTVLVGAAATWSGVLLAAVAHRPRAAA